MSAGYVGYYNNHNGADDTLTMPVFRIDGNALVINRNSSTGLHPLKSSGVRNSYKNETAYQPNLTEYKSPQKLTLYEIERPKDDILNEDGKHEKGDKQPLGYGLPLVVSIVVLILTSAGIIIF